MRGYQFTGVAAFFNEAGKEYRAFPDDRDLQCHLSLDYAEWFKPFVEVLPNVQHTPFFGKSAEIADALSRGQDPIFLGQIDAAAGKGANA